jgi:hypothetical protein
VESRMLRDQLRRYAAWADATHQGSGARPTTFHGYPTPRTDEAETEIWSDQEQRYIAYVPVELARTLEAELQDAAARHQSGTECPRCPDPLGCRRKGKCDPDGGLSV